MKTGQVLVEAMHITQAYGTDSRKFTAVQDVNLTICEGEFVALLGPSGCGKSTLLRIITGLMKPTDGIVLYRGKQLKGINTHATIVFQSFALFPWLTVQQNVEVALKARSYPYKLLSPRSLELLDRVGLDGFENAFPRELSGGMRQKVGFARAMAVEPELLCLDEPFSALDVLSADALRNELLELWTSGKIPTKAILMVTHNIEEAVSMADRIVVMEKEPGRVVSSLTVKLPHPRLRKSPAFLDVVDRVYSTLAGQTQAEVIEHGTAPGEPGPTRSLPNITINDLSTFLKHLSALPNDREDIYRITVDLQVDSDQILRLSEAAELLGFASLGQGDIIITPLGETFAEAGIQARKEIFAARIKRLPIFKWLLTMLGASDSHKLERDVTEAALGLEFPPQEAERVLEVAISWGRYAELLAYDAASGSIYLESAA